MGMATWVSADTRGGQTINEKNRVRERHNISIPGEVWQLVEKTGNASKAIEDAIIAYFSSGGEVPSRAEEDASKYAEERRDRVKTARLISCLRKTKPYCWEHDTIFEWRSPQYIRHLAEFPNHETSPLKIKNRLSKPLPLSMFGGVNDIPEFEPLALPEGDDNEGLKQP